MTKFVFGLASILWIAFLLYKNKYDNANRENKIRLVFNVSEIESLKAQVRLGKTANQIALAATVVTVFGIILLYLL